jgi:hypothetical protein
MTLGSDGTLGVGVTNAVSADGTLVAAGSNGTGQGAANTVAQINIWETTSGNKAGLWFGAMTNSNVGVIGSRTASGSIAFQTYSAGSWGERARITSAGDVGIGTSSPAAKLNTSIAAGAASSTNIHYLLSETGTNSDTGMQIKAINSTNSWDAGAITFRREGSANSYGLVFATSSGGTNNNRMTLDSSGNLGLGVTPSAWNLSGLQAMQIKNASLAGYLNNAYLSANAFFAGGWLYVGNGLASQYVQADGEHRWSIAASGTAGNAISFTQAMTLDASGNLGVGATSITGVSGYQIIETRGSIGGIYQTSASGNSVRARFYSTSDGGFAGTPTNHPFAFITNDTERARITSGGDLLVGTTDSGSGATAAKQRIIGAAANNLYLGSTSAGGWRITSDALNDGGTFYHIKFTENGTERGSITSNGTITTYNTTSDYRLKTVIGPVANAGQRIDALQPVEYTWNADGSRTRGFLAHQFQEVYASSVSGTKDAVDAEGKPVYQAMQASTSEVIADLVAEIQSLRARVAALESQA